MRQYFVKYEYTTKSFQIKLINSAIITIDNDVMITKDLIKKEILCMTLHHAESILDLNKL